MELMSSVLLVTLLTLVQFTAGKYDYRKNLVLSGNSYNDISNSMRRTLMLHSGVPLLSKVTPLQSVFMDLSCQKCSICMEWALRVTSQRQDHVLVRNLNHDQAHYDLMTDVQDSTYRHIDKRNVKDNQDESETRQRPREKRHKRSKSVTVTKFNKDNVIYALKVKETEQQHGGRDTSCQVYKVQQAYSCKSAEGEALLSVARAKKEFKKELTNEMNKNNVAQQTNDNRVTEQGIKSEEGAERSAGYESKESARSSRAADQFPRLEDSPAAGQNPESFMPSIELY